MSQHPKAFLKPRRSRPFIYRHPWVFSGAIGKMEGEPKDGDVIDVLDSNGQFIARGLFNSKSQIQVRLYSWDPAQELDSDFWSARIGKALALRAEMREAGVLGAEDACRLINSEGDSLSGLVFDWYPPFGVVQFLALGLDCRRKEILAILAEQSGIQNIYERSDGPVSKYEGLVGRTGVVLGEKPPALVPIHENGYRFLIDPRQGHKTGYYLDQRENRARAAAYARCGRVLDIFSYTGSFGIHAARSGASVLAIDESANALEIAVRNAAENGLGEDRYEVRKSSASEEMRQLAGGKQQFDTVILDPPKFARSKRELDHALRGYKEINLQALRLLREGGLLFTCSCSGAVQLENFLEMLHDAAHDARREVRVLEVHSQPSDHPVSLTCSESRYLKCLICEVG